MALEFTGPLLLAVVSSRRAIDLLWVALAALGIFMIVPKTSALSAAQSLDGLGMAFALGAGGFWVLYILFGQRLSKALHAGRASALGMVLRHFVLRRLASLMQAQNSCRGRCCRSALPLPSFRALCPTRWK